ncbi:MSMEG_0565 family glycosyltransferase [Burkholderia sp. Ac-20379]|uniref:MSMEG_0565 family glycosyltransferase n=1 Tax=Burkholderia sp. Ac-20379 TaxID=2703900 RepID=UPI00197DCA62|nr:MSMEG_0565 family glycosyltransferase [Burkholderia sp. Ac-20379]MBN3726571.1 MSMEG_0565 family glycosyltransferase [Burkholderia sp. Ac-20379]
MNAAPLRIALFTHSVNPRGGVVHTLELARSLGRAGHDVTVVAPAAPGERLFRDGGGALGDCFDLDGYRVVLARTGAAPRDTVGMVETRIAAIRGAFDRAVRARFDVLHAQDSISGNALAEWKAEGAIAGFVRTVHHLDTFANPRLAAWQRRAWRDADRVLCVSADWASRMRDEHGVAARQVANGVDLERFAQASADAIEAVRQRFGLQANGATVLAIGGIEARKNTHALLDAFAQLRRAKPHAQLAIAGGASLLDHDAYTRDFLARAAELGLPVGPGGAVVITGPLDDAALVALLHAADAVSMVSLREGFGLVVLEALACGKPVAVSRIAPFTEHLDARTAIWADPGSIDSIAQALHDALDGRRAPDFREAVPALLARFSWAASAAAHAAIYREWLDARAAASAVPLTTEQES